jgi:ElaB/YqjD/DUF883 family membrane-anchored ribosome-binding protein
LQVNDGSLYVPQSIRINSQYHEDTMPVPDIAVSKEKLAEDLKNVVADAEELLRATAGQASEKVTAARERIQGSLRNAKVKLAEVEDMVIDQGKRAADATDEYVHEHPWKAVGIAAGVGLIIGMLISRR